MYTYMALISISLAPQFVIVGFSFCFSLVCNFLLDFLLDAHSYMCYNFQYGVMLDALHGH